MTPLASILIPCSPNHLELLDRAVASAEAQTVPVEVLTFVDHDRRGPGYGRNRMAERAQGLFVCMLDADDHLYPNALEVMLDHWQPGSYVYSDWHERDDAGDLRHVEATSCYIDWRYNKEGQRAYHLTPVLFPTRLYHALGGMNEKMFSSEDTDFFYKANVNGVTCIRVHQPLFFYGAEGGHARSSSGKANKAWFEELGSIITHYQRRAIVACCGDVAAPRDIMAAAHQENDILVRTKWRGNKRVVGRATGRKYGRHGNGVQLWMDPADYHADRKSFEYNDLDVIGLSPSDAEIETALTTAQKVERAGVRNWGTGERPGLDMQQNPQEIAALLDFCLTEGVQTVLEIGTGENGGLARYMAGELGWDVTSIDVRVPETYVPARFEQGEGMAFESGGFWRLIQADSRDVDVVNGSIIEALGLADQFLANEALPAFDLVFIDGNHTREYVQADHEHYGPLGRIIAFHDISPEGYWKEAAEYWREIAYTAKGNLRKGYHEAIVPEAKTGLGWYVAR